MDLGGAAWTSQSVPNRRLPVGKASDSTSKEFILRHWHVEQGSSLLFILQPSINHEALRKRKTLCSQLWKRPQKRKLHHQVRSMADHLLCHHLTSWVRKPAHGRKHKGFICTHKGTLLFASPLLMTSYGMLWENTQFLQFRWLLRQTEIFELILANKPQFRKMQTRSQLSLWISFCSLLLFVNEIALENCRAILLSMCRVY